MADQRNNTHGDFAEIWKDIPVVLVASIGGMVTNVYPYPDRNVSDADLSSRVTHEGQLSGALFDMYLDGYCYILRLSHKEVDKIRRDQITSNQLSYISRETNPFTDIMADHIRE